ncbi:MAG: hypothetical protein DRP93_00190 [Candidatus Neomarinimicrobiota bacterium]|nr:MAG: hypothetical protein DRP93_00190 [Candidatus Neomarinimicrobiota bacterium]
MLRYRFYKGSKGFEANTVEEAAAKLCILESSVQNFFSRNKKGNLTLQGYKCEDRGAAIEEAKLAALEEKIRKEAYEQAKSDLAEAGAGVGQVKAPVKRKPKAVGS